MKEQKNKSGITLKNLMRGIAIVCLGLVCCPSFLVSCSGENKKISVITAIKGVNMYGEEIVEPHFVMVICIFIPIIMLVLLFLKRISSRMGAISIAGIGLIDIGFWIGFRTVAKRLAEENYCTFKTTVWYVINLIFLVLLVIVSVWIIVKKIDWEESIKISFPNVDMQKKLHQVSKKASAMTTDMVERTKKHDEIGYCTNCGQTLQQGTRFCPSCGKAVDKEIGKMRCKHCGAILEENSVFCTECGKNISDDTKKKMKY